MQDVASPTLIELLSRPLQPLPPHLYGAPDTGTNGLPAAFGKYAEVERMARRVVADETLLYRHAERFRSYPPVQNLPIPPEVIRRYAWFIGSWDSDASLESKLLPQRPWKEPQVRNLCLNTIYSTVENIFNCLRTTIPSLNGCNAIVVFDSADQEPDSGFADHLLLLRMNDTEAPPNSNGVPITIDHPLSWVDEKRFSVLDSPDVSDMIEQQGRIDWSVGHISNTPAVNDVTRLLLKGAYNTAKPHGTPSVSVDYGIFTSWKRTLFLALEVSPVTLEKVPPVYAELSNEERATLRVCSAREELGLIDDYPNLPLSPLNPPPAPEPMDDNNSNGTTYNDSQDGNPIGDYDPGCYDTSAGLGGQRKRPMTLTSLRSATNDPSSINPSAGDMVLSFSSSAFSDYPISYAPITPLPRQVSCFPARHPFSRIRILETLGGGSSACVYSAQIDDLPCIFAVKLTDYSLIPSGREALAYEYTQYRELASTSLPGAVIPIAYGFCTNSTFSALLLERCGPSVTNFALLSDDERAKVFDLFDRLHAAGYEHGDVNARNVVRECNSSGFRIVDLESLRPHKKCAKTRKRRRGTQEGLVDFCPAILRVWQALRTL